MLRNEMTRFIAAAVTLNCAVIMKFLGIFYFTIRECYSSLLADHARR